MQLTVDEAERDDGKGERDATHECARPMKRQFVVPKDGWSTTDSSSGEVGCLHDHTCQDGPGQLVLQRTQLGQRTKEGECGSKGVAKEALRSLRRRGVYP